jgi:hypothetical protein
MRHPDFPHLPDSVPMTYTLAMKACLSLMPKDRPSFQELETLLGDLCVEIASGSYLNSDGVTVVRPVPTSPCSPYVCALASALVLTGDYHSLGSLRAAALSALVHCCGCSVCIRTDAGTVACLSHQEPVLSRQFTSLVHLCADAHGVQIVCALGEKREGGMRTGLC